MIRLMDDSKTGAMSDGVLRCCEGDAGVRASEERRGLAVCSGASAAAVAHSPMGSPGDEEGSLG